MVAFFVLSSTIDDVGFETFFSSCEKSRREYNAKAPEILTNIGAMDPPGTKLYPTCA